MLDRKPLDLPVGALVMLPLFGLPLGAWAVEQSHIEFATCGMKRLANIPCISCGSTRATLELFHGKLFAALALQPMMMFIYLAVLTWGIVSLIGFARNRNVDIVMTPREDIAFKASLVLIPLINWAYLIWAGV